MFSIKIHFLFVFIFIMLHTGCAREKSGESIKDLFPESIAFTVENPLNLQRSDAWVELNVNELKEINRSFNSMAFALTRNNTEIASQLTADNKIHFVTDLKADEKVEFTLRFAVEREIPRDYPARSQAELSQKFGGAFKDKKYVGGAFKNVTSVRVPAEHTDHSTYFRYEGPGWESDKVGYRFYLDWRNAIDIFGKKTTDMVLQNVGQDGFDSYHEMSDWGMDILKVGNTLGLGSIGSIYNGKVVMVAKTDSITAQISANGPVYSEVVTRYYGWQLNGEKADLVSNLSILAGSRLTRDDIIVTGGVDNICTGIAKHENTVKMTSENAGSGEWQYLATWGQQSLAGDNLGVAVLYRNSQLKTLSEDEVNWIVVLTPDKSAVEYYFLAAWDKEPGGITNAEDFVSYLDETISCLNHPVNVSF